MDVAIVGIKYFDETARLIRENYNNINLVLKDFTDDSDFDINADIYIITDRLCDGQKLKPDVCIKSCESLLKNIQSNNIAIINFDDSDLMRHLMGLSCNIITYGYNTRSTVTISGFEEDMVTGKTNYVCSLQRDLLTIDNESIEPCEIKVSVPSHYNSESIMAYSAFLLIQKNF